MNASWTERTVHLQGPLTADQSAEFKAIEAMEAEARKRRAALEKAVQNNPELEQARKLFSPYVGRERVKAELNNSSSIKITITAKEQTSRSGKPSVAPVHPKPAMAPSIHLDPKTMNMMLNGSFLDGGEKKRLIRAALGGAADYIMDDESKMTLAEAKVALGLPESIEALNHEKHRLIGSREAVEHFQCLFDQIQTTAT
ncbi:hypothetical protein [Phaeobacter gallaeciensis]|uniref:hypothetical protein n=1 Tax=Phaeobacter gallaeciensis TaxID=60890 RepID=UPI00237F0302|nr:hypothetical protein [Phaeobacter gallaeciensis]MDE4189624.1 hypothetical protein [Phaeobacter gallaeciensis]MDE4198776.1 hypothetical protein [Phaeobacter gallaeciensis]MDE4202921.1 hypothetical protein [Phaeobacter gallaeciensis]MDE4207065.1 hypothetical protein [Phaeobacter gallaeciensis]MDE4215710.1 hypothetical protein [Phaeobacter gallaeciensis]